MVIPSETVGEYRPMFNVWTLLSESPNLNRMSTLPLYWSLDHQVTSVGILPKLAVMVIGSVTVVTDPGIVQDSNS